jgi:hypothetical protein
MLYTDDSIRQYLDEANSTMTKSTVQTDFQLEPTVDLTESNQNVPSTGPLGSFQQLESIFSNDSNAADLLVSLLRLLPSYHESLISTG